MKRRPLFLTAGALALSALPVLCNWSTASRRGAMEFSDYGAAWLEPLPIGAVLLARGDLIINTLSYRQVCTGLRKDIRVLDLERMTYHWHTKNLKATQPDLVVPGVRYHPTATGCYTLASLIAANPKLGPWFVAGDLTPAEIASLPGWSVRPHGLGWKLSPPGQVFDFNQWWVESEKALPSFSLPSVNRRSVDPWAASVAADFGEARNRRGVTALDAAAASQNATGILRKAISVFESEAANPAASARVFKNLGIAWQRMEGRDPNASTNAKQAWQRFLELDDGSDKDAATIRQWILGR